MSISRRHCVIFNFYRNIWIYDLNSTIGTYIDDTQIFDKYYLEYIHKISIGNIETRMHLPGFFGDLDKINLNIIYDI